MPLGAHDTGGAAAQLLDARLSRGLRRIYDHYAERSDKIRRHAVATETRARIKAGVQKLGSAGTTRAEMGDVHGKVCFAVFYQFATEYVREDAAVLLLLPLLLLLLLLLLLTPTPTPTPTPTTTPLATLDRTATPAPLLSPTSPLLLSTHPPLPPSRLFSGTACYTS